MGDQEAGSVRELRESLIEEIVRAVGLPYTRFWYKIFSTIFWLPTHRLSEVGSLFDREVAENGFQSAMRTMQAVFMREVNVLTTAEIPSSGPLLLLANHPGTYDAVVLASHVPRDDLKIVASHIPFIEKMRNANRHFFFATRDTLKRMVVIKEIVDHLRSGGAVLIFPGGHMEPDPAFMPQALDALDDWSKAVEIFVQKVPQTAVQIGIVSNLLAEKNFKNPLTRLRKNFRDRQRIGEFIQVIHQMALGKKYHNIPRLSFTAPFYINTVNFDGDQKMLLPFAIQAAKASMQEHIP